MARSVLPALALTALLALIAGCGGGDEAGGPQGAAGTETQSSARSGEPTNGLSGGGEGRGGAEGNDGEARSGGSRGDAPGGEAEGAEPGGAGQGGEGSSKGEAGAPDGDGDTPSARTAFVRRANEICARGRAEREKALARYARRNSGKPRGERVDDSLKEVYVPGLEAQIAALRRLTPPPGDAAEVGAIVEAMEGWVALVKRGGRSAKAEVDRALVRASRLARRYGLAECASA